MNTGEFERGLIAEQDLKRRMRDAGVDPADPAEREAWEAGADAALADVAAILAEARTHWARARSLNEVRGGEMLHYLELRFFPLTPGEPVMYRQMGGRRWLRGTFEGPVAHPAAPHRVGDWWVRRPDGLLRVGVFPGNVKRPGSPGPAD